MEPQISQISQISRLFDEAFGDTGNETLPTWYPAADIYETKEDYVFKSEVPGLKKDDINIELKDHTLSIKGGVLELRAAKAEEQKPKAIPISLN